MVALKAASRAASVFACTGAAPAIGLSSDGNRGSDRDRTGVRGEAARPSAPLAVDAFTAPAVGLNRSRGETNGDKSNEDSSELHVWFLADNVFDLVEWTGKVGWVDNLLYITP